MKTISGSIQGSNDADRYRVVVYAFSAGSWYVQPEARRPYALIQPESGSSNDGHWQTETQYGSKYAALVVRKGFMADSEISALPGGFQVIAEDRIEGDR